MDDLVTAIGRGELAPVYVLHSEHPVLVDRVVAAVREAAVPPAFRAFNYEVIEGKPSAARIITAAQTFPMMAARRLVYVRDLAGLPADDADELLAYVAAPNPTTVLLAVATKIDKRLKLWAQLGKRGVLHQLSAPRQLAPWVQAEARNKGVAIAPAAVHRLVDAVGDDLSRLAMALEQLAVFASGREITAGDVDELVADTREHNVFELTDALGAGSLPGALAAVASLCDQRESAIGVIAMVSRFVRQLSQIHVARAQGLSKAALAPTLGVPPFVVDKLIAASNRYAPATLTRALHDLAHADVALKGDPTVPRGITGPAMKTLGRELAERTLLENWVRQFVSAGRR